MVTRRVNDRRVLGGARDDRQAGRRARPQPGARFNPEYDESIADEIARDYDPDALWLTKQERWTLTQAKLASLGMLALPQGTPYQGRVLFRVRRAAP